MAMLAAKHTATSGTPNLANVRVLFPPGSITIRLLWWLKGLRKVTRRR
jgi:hypothetical protein